ncbi:MAG: hypothetical protein AAF602_31595 [Myxococcota bacterium]
MIMASRDDRSRVPPRPRPETSPSDDEGHTEIVRRKGSEDLEMIPVEQEDEHEALAPPPPAGATQFFPIDRPDPSDDEPETTPKVREVRQRAALFTPDRARAPERPPEPEASSTERPPLDIRGPVVPGSGPAAEGPPKEEPAAPVDLRNRTRSWRLYAVMLVLMLGVALSLVITVGVISAVVVVLQRPAPPEPVPVAVPAPVPPPTTTPPIAPVVVPEGVGEEPPEPVAPPPAPRTAAVTIRLAPGSHPFVALRIDCEEPAFRKRQSFEAGVVTIPDVPRASCIASFLGGPPVRSAVRGGDDLTCSIEGTSALCR